jgi:hypothetical protein
VTADGRASVDQLQELWRELLRNLLGIFKGPKRLSAENLQVCRKFLKDSGQVYPPDEASRKKLEKLQRLYLEALVAAFERRAERSEERPTAALLGEVRQFLEWSGHSPNVSPTQARLTARELLAMEVPFTTTKQ